MCGIAGLISREKERCGELIIRNMIGELKHRGPDYLGMTSNENQTAHFAHTRLSIIDPSSHAHQPMRSLCGKYTIVFNGEIYNYPYLKQMLTDHGEQFTTGSDTEVLLKLFMRYRHKCLGLLDGMYAFAVYSESDHTCFLARDPLGIKPLYYSLHGARLVFASELKAFLKDSSFAHNLDGLAACDYFQYGSVQEPRTLMEGVSMLPPGHWLEWHEGKTQIKRYWRFPNFSPQYGYHDESQRLRTHLEAAVSRHLVSDVPVGLFLSGGIDSTTLAVLAKKCSKQPLYTFSVSFENPDYDESEIARRTAESLGFEHENFKITPQKGMELFDEYMAALDQPSIDGFNTFCVAKMARTKDVKVVLSGLGSDELFGGYKTFSRMHSLSKRTAFLKALKPLLIPLAKGFQLAGKSKFKRLGEFILSPMKHRDIYRLVRGVFTEDEAKHLCDLYEIKNAERYDHPDKRETPHDLEMDEISRLELSRYMLNQLLRDSDVMSMAHGLELRVPFLDKELVEFVMTLEPETRFMKNKGLLLKAVPEIPQWVLERPKQGFMFPFNEWMSRGWQDKLKPQAKVSGDISMDTWYRAWCLRAFETWLKRIS